MEMLLQNMNIMQLNDSPKDSPTSDLLGLEPGPETLPQLLKNTQGLACGPSQNSLGVQRGLQLLEAGDSLEALHYLAECHSTTLRQYMIMKSSCRLAQLQVKAGSRRGRWPAGTQEALLDTRRRLLQYRPSPHRRQEMLDIIQQVPSDWTVIQLTAVPRSRCRLTRHDTPELVLCRFDGGAARSLLVTRVPAPPSDHCCTFRSEFEAMLADNGSIQRSLSNDRQRYWTERGLLDDRMKSIVRSMEVAWLGRHAYLVSGAVLSPAQRSAVQETVDSLPDSLSSEQRARLSLLCASLPESAAGLAAAVDAALGPTAGAAQQRAVREALSARRDELRAAGAGARRGQVILVLDKEVQRYPWEMVGALVLGPVCRLPSLAILGLCLAGRSNRLERPLGVPAAGGATYILNPAGDLTNTEQRMGPFLEERGWNGIVGRPPTLKEFADALTDGQILAYCGHGSGSQYLPSEKLRSLTCNAVALLFGCSSGQLVQPGPSADPHGSVHAYLMANCPAILGNLWSVTDNMLDTYSKAVIENWTDGRAERSLPEAVSAARGSVPSSFMAAAPVVYGLPVAAGALERRGTDGAQTQQADLLNPEERQGDTGAEGLQDLAGQRRTNGDRSAALTPAARRPASQRPPVVAETALERARPTGRSAAVAETALERARSASRSAAVAEPALERARSASRSAAVAEPALGRARSASRSAAVAEPALERARPAGRLQRTTRRI